MDSYYADIIQQMANKRYRPDLIIALSRGGLDMGVKFSNYFNDVPLEPLVWQTRDGAIKEMEKLRTLLSKYDHKDILIVDDILDSGETLRQIHEVVTSNTCFAVVDYAVAIENTDEDFEVAYSARTISRLEEDQWFVFPWENWWKK